MIRVCHVADHLNGEIDGVYTHIIEIINLTDKAKFEHYLCFQGNSKIEREVIKLGGKIISLPQLKSKFPLRAILRFTLLVKQHEINIIHTHFIKSYIVAGLSNIVLRRKHVYNYHGLFIKNEYYNFIQKIFYKFFHNLICWFGSVHEAIVPSEESGNQLFQETRLFPRISQYYNGAECKKETNTLNDEILMKIKSVDSFKLVYAGRIEAEKRIDRSLDLIRLLMQNEIKAHLFIFGTGKLFRSITDLIKEFSIKKNVTMLGAVPSPEDYFGFFDCLILTSDREGMPFVVWEAMANGLPVISSSVGGITEVLRKSKSGFTFERENLFEALEKIQLLINKNNLKVELGQNGIKAINEVFTLKNFKDFIEKLYLSL